MKNERLLKKQMGGGGKNILDVYGESNLCVYLVQRDPQRGTLFVDMLSVQLRLRSPVQYRSLTLWRIL